MGKKRFIFIDLYNLHLATGPILTEYLKTNTISPDLDVREKLLQFFKDHASDLLKYTTPDGVRRNHRTPSGEIKKADLDEASSLGWYELRFAISWFETMDFLCFARQYQGLREFVDEYLEEELSFESLSWLQRETFGRKLCIFVKSPQGKVYPFPHRELSGKLKKIPLSRFHITPDWRTVVPEIISDEDFYCGVEVRSLFFDIYVELADLLEGKYKIDRCAYWNCHNIFWKSRITHKYCCTRHCHIVAQTRYRKKGPRVTFYR